MDRKLLYYKILSITKDTNSDRLLRGYSTCFIMTGLKNNDRNNVFSVLEKKIKKNN